MKITYEDRLFSWYVRALADWKCERCGRQYEPPTTSLQCSHYHKRRHKTVRYDLDNCDSLCYGCHSLFEQNREDWVDRHGRKHMGYTSWKLNKLGQPAFDLLTLRKNEYKKLDYKLIRIWLRAELTRLKILPYLLK